MASGAYSLRTYRWRVGQSLGRTVYAQIGSEPSKTDVLLGMMDTRELAELVVTEHNQGLDVATEKL